MDFKRNSPASLKIAFLGNQIAYGGGAKSLLLLIKSLRGQNIESCLYVTHIASDEMKKEFEEYVTFVKLIDLPEVTGAQTESEEANKNEVNENVFNYSTIESFAKELNNNGFDILHINNSVFSPIYNIIKLRTNVKIVTHIREWIHWNGVHSKQNYMIRNIDKYSDSLICISNTEAEVFLNHPKIHVIPNPFDFEELELLENNKDVVKKRNGIDIESLLVGMMSSFQKNKGVLDFLKALAHLKQFYSYTPNYKFVFLGQKMPTKYTLVKAKIKKLLRRNNFLLEVYDFIKNNNLLNDIIFLSNRKEVLEIITCFDIAVRPSYTGDPWGRDIIEYMALSKPIIATGSSDFFIEDEKTGFLVPVHDYKKMAEKIYWLIKNDKVRSTMGKSAYNVAYNRCNINIFRQQVLNVYSSILNKNEQEY